MVESPFLLHAFLRYIIVPPLADAGSSSPSIITGALLLGHSPT